MANYKALVEKYNPSQGTRECTDLLIKVSRLKPKVILEIGVHLGRSLALWNEAFSPEILIGIDTDNRKVDIMDQLARFKRGDKEYFDFHYLAPFDSLEVRTWNKVTKILGGRHVDFLFIDGDHTYTSAKYDYMVYSQLVRPGGIIAMHDVALEGEQWENLVETKRVFEEIEADKEILHSDGTGCGIIYV